MGPGRGSKVPCEVAKARAPGPLSPGPCGSPVPTPGDPCLNRWTEEDVEVGTLKPPLRCREPWLQSDPRNLRPMHGSFSHRPPREPGRHPSTPRPCFGRSHARVTSICVCCFPVALVRDLPHQPSPSALTPTRVSRRPRETKAHSEPGPKPPSSHLVRGVRSTFLVGRRPLRSRQPRALLPPSHTATRGSCRAPAGAALPKPRSWPALPGGPLAAAPPTCPTGPASRTLPSQAPLLALLHFPRPLSLSPSPPPSPPLSLSASLSLALSQILSIHYVLRSLT